MPRILYEFIASGQNDVRGAFRGIGEDARAADKAQDESMRRMRSRAQETTRAASRSATHQEKLAEKVAADQTKNARYLAGVKDRYFRDEQRREDQASRQKEREATRALASRRREIAADVSAKQKHETRLQSVAQKATDKRADAERKHQQRLTQIREQSERRLQQITSRAREATARRDEARTFDRSLVQRQRALVLDKKRAEIQQRARDEIKGEIRSGIKGAVIGGAVATGALAAGITGAAARDAMRLQEVSNRLSISSRGAGEQAVDASVLRKEFEQTAIKTPGVRSIDIAEAVQQFVGKTGNLDVARKSQGVFATVASATGSQVQDVAAAAADLFQKFDINTVDGMADAMAALAFQGKAGAFELKDAASQFAKLSAAASRFGIAKGAEGVRVLGGLTQIARTATGSPEQAATAVEAMFRQFTSGAAQKQLKSIGVNPFKDKAGTQTRDIRELIVETISKSGGNLTKLQGIFGEEGIRAISPVISAFNEAEKTKKGSGAGAAKSFIEGAINAPGDYAELQKDAAQAQTDASAKLASTWESLSSKIGEGVLPVMTKFADMISSSPAALDAFVSVIDLVTSVFGGLVFATQEVLEAFGLASKKKKTPEQLRDEERAKASTLQKQLEAFDKKRGGSWEEEQKLRKAGKTKEADAMASKLFATAGMDAERATIAGRLDVAKRNVGEANAAVLQQQDQQKNIRSSAAFAEEYAKMLGPEEYKGQNQGRAEMVGRALREGALIDSQFTSQKALEGESEAARQFRVNQAGARREDLQNAGVTAQGESGSATADKGAQSITAAAEKLAAAIRASAEKLGPTPSIVGPSG